MLLKNYLCLPALDAVADLGAQALFFNSLDQSTLPHPDGLDRIVHQDPAPGAQIGSSAEVKFRVVVSPPVPDFQGETVAAVLEALECYGWQLEIHEPGGVRPAEPGDHARVVQANAPTSIAHQPLDIGGTVGVVLVPPPP
jgi:beta-lactam-binding protein with PASTA domain